MSRFRKTSLGKFRHKALTKLRRLEKRLYWSLPGSRTIEKTVVLVVGCQRSGTRVLNQVFERDPRAWSLSENNCLTGTELGRLRLKPVDEVNRLLQEFPTPVVVLKPLVESQNAPDLLQSIPGSVAIWMFRNYRDVVNSKVRKFHGQISDVRALVDREPGNWRSEHLSDETHAIISRFYSDELSRYDAAALMWYARNRLYFERGLDNHPRMILCQYEDLVTTPSLVVRQLYQHIGIPYPNRTLTAGIDCSSVGLGTNVPLNPDVERLCADLQGNLEQRYAEESTVHEKCTTLIP